MRGSACGLPQFCSLTGGYFTVRLVFSPPPFHGSWTQIEAIVASHLFWAIIFAAATLLLWNWRFRRD